MISVLLSRLVLLVFGTLYPAYASYKTVKTKNVRDYVKWMMYWVVFAVYTFIEIFSDIFVAFWCPFYYEIKILFVFWLICPATKGSTYLFRKLVNPHLSKHEKVIDSYLSSLWDQGCDVIKKLGAQGIDYLIEIILEFIQKGKATASNLVPVMLEPVQREKHKIHEKHDEPTENEVASDEEFAILTLEKDVMDKEHNFNSPPVVLPENEFEDYDSESEADVKSVKSRPLKLRTRSQAKVSAAKGRKKSVK